MTPDAKVRLTARLEAYLAMRVPDAGRVQVAGLERISGGASRETFRFVLRTGPDDQRASAG